jgi:transcriptional regulator of heat shock response
MQSDVIYEVINKLPFSACLAHINDENHLMVNVANQNFSSLIKLTPTQSNQLKLHEILDSFDSSTDWSKLLFNQKIKETITQFINYHEHNYKLELTKIDEKT